ncbi:MAG TPA: TolC family protein [Acidobacteriaceae bacterium]|nr:TolC family protein [Acidobacteriaceae bacterium]
MNKFSVTFTIWCLCGLLFFAIPAAGQDTPASSLSIASQAVAPQSQGATLHITLQDAIERAKKLSPALTTALTNAKLAAEATVQARAANLPNVSGNSQYLYTEGNGTLSARFIANNGVHEYIAQTDVHQAISAPLLVDYRRSIVLHAVAQDQATIAERGLVVAVVQAYATLFGANGKLKTGEESLQAAQHFVTITTERQKNGDAAYADVLKARIQADDSQSALANAQLALEQARVALALLIFPNVNQPFDLMDDPSQVLTLPPRSQAQQEASTSNPELDAASKSVEAARQSLLSGRLGYLPSLTFDYYYGIDANRFATETTLYDGKRIQNLGYSALATLSVPLFTWGATHSKVTVAKSEEDLARVNLGFARQKAAGDFDLYYNEAQVARQNLKTRLAAYTDAMESRRLTLLQYRAGVATALEVVTAEATVDTESTALYDAKTRYATAIANLATLTGVL